MTTILEVMQGWLEQKTLAQPEIVSIWNAMANRPHGYVATLASPECTIAITAAAIKAGCPEMVHPECGANNMYEAMRANEVSLADAVPGLTLVFFNWSKAQGENNETVDHVGILEYTDNIDDVTTVEANVNGHRMHRRRFSLAAYLRKYGANSVRFVKLYPRAEEVVLQGDPTPVQPPEDKGPSGWAREAADWAQIAGLFQGDKDGSMRWQDPITREELAVVLYRFKVMLH